MLDPRHQDAELIFQAGLKRVDSQDVIRQTVFLKESSLTVTTETERLELDLKRFKRVLVFAVGKASARMTLGLVNVLGDLIEHGLVITKDGHDEPLPPTFHKMFSSHPVPDERSVEAGRKLLEFAQSATADDLVIGLISGGASALAALPRQGLSLKDKQDETRRLLASGATIQEINAVRKSLSLIKGGKLAAAMAKATSVNLILSDVVGDDLGTIASGLTVIEPSPPRLHNMIVGSNRQALLASADEAKRLGYQPMILSTRLTGEAKDVARDLYLTALRKQKEHSQSICLLAGGETTVTFSEAGKGGRNQEMALSFLIELMRQPDRAGNIVFLSVATDGGDGPTDAAGAYASLAFGEQAKKLGLEARQFLNRHDSYHFFDQIKGLVRTGPTRTNVCDLQIVLVGHGSVIKR